MQIPAAQSASQDLSGKHRKRCKNQCFQQRHQETSTISLDGSATVTQKSFRNVGKTSKTSIPGVNGWGGSLRGPNDGMVIQTDADAENHWKSLGKQRFHNAAYTFRNNCLLWRQCSSADGNGYQKTSQNVGKTSKICKIKCLANPGSVQCTAGQSYCGSNLLSPPGCLSGISSPGHMAVNSLPRRRHKQNHVNLQDNYLVK